MNILPGDTFFLQSSKTVESKFETLLEAHSVKGCWFNSGGFQKLKKLKFQGKFYFIFLACEEGEHKGEAIVLFLAENNDDQDHVNDCDDQGCTFSIITQGRRL